MVVVGISVGICHMRWFSFAALCAVVSACLLFSGCANRGFVEFQAYSKAFDLQYEQADRVLLSLALAEKRAYAKQRKYFEKTSRSFKQFDPAEAAYYVDTVEPPVTASLRKTLVTVSTYNAVLLSLANGETADAFSARVGTLITDVVATGAAASVAVNGPDAVKGSEVLVKNVGGKLEQLLPILRTISRLQGQEAFRTLMARTHPTMKQVLAELIAGSRDMYNLMYASRVTVGSPTSYSGVDTADLSALEKERAELAGWVLMLRASIDALDAAAAAAADTGNSTDVAGLAGTASDMRALAEQVRAARLGQEDKK